MGEPFGSCDPFRPWACDWARVSQGVMLPAVTQTSFLSDEMVALVFLQASGI